MKFNVCLSESTTVETTAKVEAKVEIDGNSGKSNCSAAAAAASGFLRFLLLVFEIIVRDEYGDFTKRFVGSSSESESRAEKQLCALPFDLPSGFAAAAEAVVAEAVEARRANSNSLRLFSATAKGHLETV